MAFESIHIGPQEKSLKKLSRALRRLIPEKFLLVGLDPIRCAPGRKFFGVFYDREAHQAEYDEVNQRNARARELHNDVVVMLEPPYHDRLRHFIDGYLAR